MMNAVQRRLPIETVVKRSFLFAWESRAALMAPFLIYAAITILADIVVNGLVGPVGRPVQFLLAGAQPADSLGQSRIQRPRRGWRAGGRRPGSRRDSGLECVPLVTMRTLPLPLGGISTAVPTNKYGTRASHLCVGESSWLGFAPWTGLMTGL